MDIQQVIELIEDVPDFPKPGITFKDITPIFENPEAFQALADILNESIAPEVKTLAAIESRGFILASAMAMRSHRKVVLLRKPGKLPRETFSEEYELEYGTDKLEIHKTAVQKDEPVCIVDDILATGGTASAAENLVTKAGGKVSGHVFLMELGFLNGGSKLNSPYKSLYKLD